MRNTMAWKVGLIALVVGLCVYSYLSKGVKLGLDLQGGMHLVLEVQVQKAVESAAQRHVTDIRSALKDRGATPKEVFRDEQNRLHIILADEAGLVAAEDLLEDYYTLKRVSTDPSTFTLLCRLSEDYVSHVEENAVVQALATIRNRVDQFGVAEPVIQREGERRIIVQLPGVEDPRRAINLIGRTALLEFKLVDEGVDVSEALRGTIPAGDEILYEVQRDPVTQQIVKRTPYVLKKTALLTGDVLTDAEVRIDQQFQEPYVSLNFDKTGARQFGKITAANVGKRLAIVLDGVVYSAPVIREEITGGRAQITGAFTDAEARDLAIVLRAGSLPAPVDVLENLTVGPSLGADSIRKGIISIIVGGLLVVAFMVAYYRLSGFIADAALVLNVVILMGMLAYLDATLTLPGIAGIILTVGMAVDANVLIFQRIKEELGMDKTVRAAVREGYSRAILTILDANITTLIAALVLFQFGTGPVKGFAVTLSLGLVSSMFTAIFVTRCVFDLILRRPEVRRLSI